MPINSIIAQGVQPIDVSNSLMRIATLKRADEELAMRQRRDALEEQRYAATEQAAADLERKKQALARVEWALQSPSPAASILNDPEAVEAFAAQGIDLTGLDDDRARQFLGVARAQMASELGEGPPEQTQEKSRVGTVPVDKYTPASLARFQQTGNYADLQPIERPAGSGSLSLPDGTHITFGAGGQPNYAPTKTGGATRSNLEKAFVDAQGNAMSLQQALQGWRPEFSTYAGQFKAAAGNVQEKAGMTVDPQTQEYLKAYNSWRSNVASALSQYLNQLSGAAISPAEEARLKASFPNDGDGPTGYYQKTLATMRRLSLVQARSAYLLSNPSLTLDSVSLDQMQNIMVAEANKLAAMYEKNGGMTPEQAKQKALQDTRARFGIGGQ